MKKELSFHRDQLFQLLTKRLDFWVDEEEDKRFDEEGGLSEEDHFRIRADIIQAVFAANNDFTGYLKDNFKAELYHRKADLFPRSWMLKDNKIKDAIDRCSRFLPIINALHNRNRYAREELKVMQTEVDKITGKNKIETLKKGAAYISYFTGNAEFYDDLKTRTDIPVNTIKKYIAAFIKIGIVKKIHDGGKGGTLYADGWFQQTQDNQLQKYPFLIQTAGIKKGLRMLPSMINL